MQITAVHSFPDSCSPLFRVPVPDFSNIRQQEGKSYYGIHIL